MAGGVVFKDSFYVDLFRRNFSTIISCQMPCEPLFFFPIVLVYNGLDNSSVCTLIVGADYVIKSFAVSANEPLCNFTQSSGRSILQPLF